MSYCLFFILYSSSVIVGQFSLQSSFFHFFTLWDLLIAVLLWSQTSSKWIALHLVLLVTLKYKRWLLANDNIWASFECPQKGSVRWVPLRLFGLPVPQLCSRDVMNTVSPLLPHNQKIQGIACRESAGAAESAIKTKLRQSIKDTSVLCVNPNKIVLLTIVIVITGW